MNSDVIFRTTSEFKVVYNLSSPVVGSHSVGLGTGEFIRPQGAIPCQAFTPFERLGFLPGAWVAPNKVNAVGAEGIYGRAGRVWGSALRPDPP